MKFLSLNVGYPDRELKCVLRRYFLSLLFPTDRLQEKYEG
jgi:hypothetical protein